MPNRLVILWFLTIYKQILDGWYKLFAWFELGGKLGFNQEILYISCYWSNVLQGTSPCFDFMGEYTCTRVFKTGLTQISWRIGFSFQLYFTNDKLKKREC